MRLRSANRGNANNTWNVNTSGNANNNNANNANRPAPDCGTPADRKASPQAVRTAGLTQGAETPAGNGEQYNYDADDLRAGSAISIGDRHGL